MNGFNLYKVEGEFGSRSVLAKDWIDAVDSWKKWVETEIIYAAAPEPEVVRLICRAEDLLQPV